MMTEIDHGRYPEYDDIPQGSRQIILTQHLEHVSFLIFGAWGLLHINRHKRISERANRR